MCITQLPEPPYYAVIFTSMRTTTDNGYSTMADLMLSLANQQTGFLGVESARNDTGITVSYWRSLDDINNWKQNIDHQKAQQLGREQWYQHYTVRICKVEKQYTFIKSD